MNGIELQRRAANSSGCGRCPSAHTCFRSLQGRKELVVDEWIAEEWIIEEWITDQWIIKAWTTHEWIINEWIIEEWITEENILYARCRMPASM